MDSTETSTAIAPSVASAAPPAAGWVAPSLALETQRASPHVCARLIDSGEAKLRVLNIRAANICAHSNDSKLRQQPGWRNASNLNVEALAGSGQGSHEQKTYLMLVGVIT